MRLILRLLGIAVIIAIAVYLADHPGTARLHWLGWQIETSVALLAFVLLVAGVAVWLVFSALQRLWRAPRNLAQRRREAHRLQGHRALTDGLVAIAAGDVDAAERQSQRAQSHFAKGRHPAPPLIRLVSAQAALLRHDHATARTEFAALAEHKETEFLGLRGLIVQAMKSGDDATALRLIERADRLRPGTGWVLKSRLALEARAGEWRQADETLDGAKRHRAIGADVARRHRVALFVARSIDAERDGRHRDALTHAARAYGLDRGFAPAATRYAELLARDNQAKRALKVLEACWARASHPAVAALYDRLVAGEAPAIRLGRFERLAAARPQDNEAHLAAAAVALAARLWGEARRHLSLAGADGPGPWSARLCHLAAELAAAEHQDQAAARRWLDRVAQAPAEPRWVCTNCGAEQDDWVPVCRACGMFDGFSWRVPHHGPARVAGGMDTTALQLEAPALVIDADIDRSLPAVKVTR